jgi:zinc and cadmium transporter
MPLLLLAVPILSTMIGGLLAIRFRRYVSLLIALGAGLLLGAAFLDLLPEAINLGQAAGISIVNVLAMTLLAFLLFYGFESALDWLGRRFQNSDSGRRTVRRTGAAMLIFHSFRDGMAIGAAFAASHPAGYAVAIGIAAHDLGDGMNTILLTTDGRSPTRVDFAFLVADAVAPFLGGILTIWWVFSRVNSVLLLALAAGFFIHMATGDFLPELRRSAGPRRFLIPSILTGSAFIYLANLLIERGH